MRPTAAEQAERARAFTTEPPQRGILAHDSVIGSLGYIAPLWSYCVRCGQRWAVASQPSGAVRFCFACRREGAQ